ncbi:MAG TPA: endolytic transglycosylase MltG [Thermoleophilaceae bacterium]|nr:endolytic transglycosylase MltG [Thermoleophilaceae bacterium]
MSPRSDNERERARLEREARRAARADRAASAERPHSRERVEAALARSRARRDPRPVPPPTNGTGDGPPRRRRRGRILVPLLVVIALLAVAVGWSLYELYQPGKGAGTGRVAVVVPHGGTLGVIADRLDGAGVIANPFFFKLRTRMAGHANDLKPGRYVLQKDMPYGDVITKLTVGPARNVINVTIPEGRARSEIAPLVKQAGVKGSYMRATVRSAHLRPRDYGAPRGATLEGFLFPSTYELKRGATVRALVARQLDAFKQNFAKVGMSYARKKNLTAYDVVTIASMVEREASLDRERPLIAAVIYNRLKQGIPLGIDATIRYATHNWTRPLHVSELQINSGYNTRTHQGLPPGPIGNPGLASLEAAAHPARAKYLFYVVKPCGDGAHAFSSTDAQFQRDVAKYNAARAKKGGKSPAQC